MYAKVISSVFALFLVAGLAIADEKFGGIVKIYSKAGYVARFSVNFTMNGQQQSIPSGDFIAGGQRWVQIPLGGANATLIIENEVWINVWNEVVTLEVPVDADTCLNIWGTTYVPEWVYVTCW